MEAYADTTAASAFFFASASAVLFSFQPSASNPVHTSTAAPASAPRQKCFVPTGNSGILNSMAPPLRIRGDRSLHHPLYRSASASGLDWAELLAQAPDGLGVAKDAAGKAPPGAVAGCPPTHLTIP